MLIQEAAAGHDHWHADADREHRRERIYFPGDYEISDDVVKVPDGNGELTTKRVIYIYINWWSLVCVHMGTCSGCWKML